MPKHGKILIYTSEKKWLHAPNLMKICHMVYSPTPYNGHSIHTGHFVEYLKSNLQTGIKVTFSSYLMFLTHNPFLQLLFSNICHIFFCQSLFRNNGKRSHFICILGNSMNFVFIIKANKFHSFKSVQLILNYPVCK